MIGLKSIGCHIPARHLDNVAQGARFEQSEEFMREKIGALELPRMEPGEDTSDLATLAVQRLAKVDPEFDLNDVGALFVVTQNPDGAGLPHTSAIVHEKLGLEKDVAAFDISLGCSGFVYGIYALKGFMEATGITNGLLVTADPYSKIIDPDDRITSLLFGDAATATWMGQDPIWELGPSMFGTDGSGAASLRVEGGRLHMNGRKVFDFAALRMAPAIKKLLDSSGLDAADIDAYCIHQGSAAIVDTISRRFGPQKDRFIKDLGTTGNTISSSIPLLIDRHAISSWRRMLVSGFGVGLSWGSAILNRTKEP